MVTKWSKNGPQMVPKWSQHGPKRGMGPPKGVQKWSRTGLHRPRGPPRIQMRPGGAQVEAKRRQAATRGRTAELQGAPRWPQGEAKEAQEEARVRPREAKRSPSGAQGSQDRGQGEHRRGKGNHCKSFVFHRKNHYLEPWEAPVELMLGTRCMVFASGVWSCAHGAFVDVTLGSKDGTWSSFCANWGSSKIRPLFGKLLPFCCPRVSRG